jgi:hypothetical protein
MRRAVQHAQEALHPVGWSSVVCVLLDRAHTRVTDKAVGHDDNARCLDATRAALKDEVLGELLGSVSALGKSGPH